MHEYGMTDIPVVLSVRDNMFGSEYITFQLPVRAFNVF